MSIKRASADCQLTLERLFKAIDDLGMPDDTIVTTQCWDPWQSEKYIISSNSWKNEGPIPARVVDPVMHEMGPGMLMYAKFPRL